MLLQEKQKGAKVEPYCSAIEDLQWPLPGFALNPREEDAPVCSAFLGCFSNQIFVRERRHIKMPEYSCNHALSAPFSVLLNLLCCLAIRNPVFHAGSANLVAPQSTSCAGSFLAGGKTAAQSCYLRSLVPAERAQGSLSTGQGVSRSLAPS